MTVDNYSVLEIMTICGKDLPNVDFFKKQDPYIHFEIGPISKLTRVDKGGGRNPQWNHRTRYENMPNPVTDIMKVRVMDDELIGKPKLIAECEINLEEIFQTGDKDGWFQLRDKNEKPAGALYMELTFYGADGVTPRRLLLQGTDTSALPMSCSIQ